MTFGLDLMISLQKAFKGSNGIMFPSRFGILASQMVQQASIFRMIPTTENGMMVFFVD